MSALGEKRTLAHRVGVNLKQTSLA